MKPLVTMERLKEVLGYDADRGVFTWLIALPPNIKGGEIAGSKNSGGYVHIKIDTVLHKAHRLALFYTNGTWPAGEVDHVNGDRTDNRLSNLRDVSKSINQGNRQKANKHNVTGFLGVYRFGKRYKAEIQSNKQRINLGVYDTPQKAHEAYLVGKRSLHVGCTL